ncbi:MAG: hypothetical protein GKR87_10405 [Kiritimatiellae bacterium]|nr:hypothetical protein [Kiritimatiellia bacterium]
MSIGETNLTIDVGLTQSASIGDFVWNDLDADGIQDVGEPGLANVPIYLYTNEAAAPISTNSTDTNGI